MTRRPASRRWSSRIRGPTAWRSRLVQCGFAFDAPCLAVQFPSVGLSGPMRRADQSIGAPLRAMAERVAADRSRSTLEQSVREHLRAKLSSEPQWLARQLHVSERTLRRKLEAEGLSLRALLDDERRHATGASSGYAR